MADHRHNRERPPIGAQAPRVPGYDAAESPTRFTSTSLPVPILTASSLASELRQSLDEQPQAGPLRMVVSRSQAAQQALAEMLGQVIKRQGLGSLRMASADGKPLLLPLEANVGSLVAAILTEGASLTWTAALADTESLGLIAKLGFTASRIAHGAHRWERTPQGVLSRNGQYGNSPRPFTTAKPTSLQAITTACEVVISLPVPRRLAASRPALSLPSLPVNGDGLDSRHRELHAVLRRLEAAGTSLAAEERSWLDQYTALLAHMENKVTTEAPKPAIKDQTSPDPEQQAKNTKLFEQERRKRSNHAVRQERLAKLLATCSVRPLTEKEQRQISMLQRLVARDAANQSRIDRLLDDAVDRRAHLVTTQRGKMKAVPSAIPSPAIRTRKGAYIIYPAGIDPRDQEAVAAWLMEGFNKHLSKATSPMVDFQITFSDSASMDREWTTYVVRRICRAIGRDPDKYAIAATHEPDVHAPSKIDGKPIQPHSHIAVLTCNADGSLWRCPNMHLVIQRELAAIDRERGWALTTSSVAKGRQAYWYSEKGSATIGWTVGGQHYSTDGVEATTAVASEVVPADIWSRPGAGMVVINAQHSARRDALRRQDARELATASAAVESLLGEARRRKIDLPLDKRGRIMLRYFSGSQWASSLDATDRLLADLARAVLKRDAVASALVSKRIDYYGD